MIVNEIIDIIRIVLGAILISLIGRDRFHLLSQNDGSRLGQFAKKFAAHRYLRSIVVGQIEISKDKDRSTRSFSSLDIYSDASLGGFAMESLPKGDQHNPLEYQLRTLLLPEVREAIEMERRLNPNKDITVLEIGTGNGDVTNLLAENYPEVNMVGVDFDISVAKNKYTRYNLRFIEFYILDDLENGGIHPDIIFASSTFTVVTPAELVRYAKALKSNGVRSVIISDPLTRRYHPDKFPGVVSRHMSKGLWGHDYRGYFSEEGYKTHVFRVENYKGHKKIPSSYMQIYWEIIED
jgi:SAM-dependent methyltransferase